MTLGADFDHILDAARAGGEWAWARLYDDVSPVVLGYLRTRGAPDADDLLGSTFLDVVRNIGRFEGAERDFRAWVLTIAHRRLVDERRRQTRAEELPRPRAITPGDVEHEALERLGTERIRRLIGTLTPDQQDVLLLRILADMTIEEIARAIGKRPGAVKALQRRALASLRRELVEEGVTL